MYIRAAGLLPHPPIVIPEVGGREAKVVEKTYLAMDEVASRLAAQEPETLIIISPHGNLFRDSICIMETNRLEGDLADYGAGQVKFSYEVDLELITRLKGLTRDFPLLFLDEVGARSLGSLGLDHGATVPLYLLDRQWKNKPKILHINYGFLDASELKHFGGLLHRAIREEKRRAVILASGDMSHRLKAESNYGFHRDGPVFDKEIKRIIDEGSLDEFFLIDEELADNAAECGLRSLQILAGALDGLALDKEVLSYEGPWGVGYMCAYMEVRDREDLLVGLAKRVLHEKILYGRDYQMGGEYDELRGERAGCFVTLYKDGRLRGCIGTIEATCSNLAEEIAENAIKAAFEDPRFPRLEEDELEGLVISVDVLGPIESCSYKDLDPKNYGLIVRSGYRRGLLLPGIPGIDSARRQVEIAKNKAGIYPEEKVDYFRFRVIRHAN